LDNLNLTLFLLPAGVVILGLTACAFRPVVRRLSGGRPEAARPPGAAARRLAHGVSAFLVALLGGALVILNRANGLEEGMGWPEAVWQEGSGYRVASNAWSNTPWPPVSIWYACLDLLIALAVLASSAVVYEAILRRGIPGLKQVPRALLWAGLIVLALILARWSVWPTLLLSLSLLHSAH
jgi:hypothetical protein